MEVAVFKELQELSDLIAAQKIEEPSAQDLSHRKDDPRVKFIGTIVDDELKRLYSCLHGENHQEMIEHLGNFVDLSGPDEDPPKMPVDKSRKAKLYGYHHAALGALFDLALHKRFPDLLDKKPWEHLWVTEGWNVFLVEKLRRRTGQIAHG